MQGKTFGVQLRKRKQRCQEEKAEEHQKRERDESPEDKPVRLCLHWVEALFLPCCKPSLQGALSP